MVHDTCDGTHLEQNQLVQQYTFSHVGERDAHHDNKGSNVEAIAPCFEDQFVGVGRLRHIDESLVGKRHSVVIHGYWSHRKCGRVGHTKG